MVDNQLKNPEITSKSANPRRPIERPLENRLDSPFMDSENPKKTISINIDGYYPRTNHQPTEVLNMTGI